MKLKVSVVLNVILVLLICFAGIYKFTNVRELGGEAVSYASNKHYEPCVEQANGLSRVDDCDVVMVGDSLTMFGLWEEFFPESIVLNRGIDGDVSEGVLNRLDTVTNVKPEKVFIMIGTNDVARHLDKDETIENMKAILNELAESLPGSTLYVESVLPRTTQFTQEIEALNKDYETLCSTMANAEFVDMYDLYCDEEGVPDTSLFTTDGYHLSGEGYKLWVEQIRDEVLS